MNTQELQLAILHKVISELDDVGKTKLQKLGYFLQEAYGVSTKFPFRMHHYGPYSEALETDIPRLTLCGYDEGRSLTFRATDFTSSRWIAGRSSCGIQYAQSAASGCGRASAIQRNSARL